MPIAGKKRSRKNSRKKRSVTRCNKKNTRKSCRRSSKCSWIKKKSKRKSYCRKMKGGAATAVPPTTVSTGHKVVTTDGVPISETLNLKDTWKWLGFLVNNRKTIDPIFQKKTNESELDKAFNVIQTEIEINENLKNYIKSMISEMKQLPDDKKKNMLLKDII